MRFFAKRTIIVEKIVEKKQKNWLERKKNLFLFGLSRY